MPDRSRPRRNPARYLAPLALAATIAGTYLIVSHSVTKNSTPTVSRPGNNSGHTGTGTTNTTSTTHESGTVTTTQTTTPGSTFYVVRAGDTLSAIAVRNHVTVAAIEQLNPTVSANALRVGERLRIRS